MTNVIRYKFRGELDVDLLAKNMREDKTPIVIVIEKGEYSCLYILKKYGANYKGADLPLTKAHFFHIFRNSLATDYRDLISWSFMPTQISDILSNIKAIIKSHEDASLPTVKVIAIETTADWRER